MKYFLLELLAKRLDSYKQITRARRVENNSILIEFDFDHTYIFDLTRGQSTVYPIDETPIAKEYNAPFDVNLKRLLTKAKLESARAESGNRVLLLTLISPQVYKEVRTILRLEFTGRHTNAILLNEHNIVIDALRHINKEHSFREIMPSRALAPLAPMEIKEKREPVEEIDAYLKKCFCDKVNNTLEEAQNGAIGKIKKRQQKILEHLDSLQNPASLLEESDLCRKHAEILYGRQNEIKDIYAKEIYTEDFDGTPLTIPLPEESINAKDGARLLHQKSKKLSQKAKNLTIEEENLKEKVVLYNRMIHAIKQTTSIHEISFYYQKQESKQKNKRGIQKNYVQLNIDGYDVIVGRNSTENGEVLRDSKGEDIWMHVQNAPSSHLIIKTNKNKINENILVIAAKVCVNYSFGEKGSFLVDYTKRKYVNIIEGSNVTYKNQKTLRIYKE